MRIRVTGHDELGHLARRLREASAGGLMLDVKAELEQDARPVLSATRAAVRAAEFPDREPKGGAPPTGFRANLAAATDTMGLSDGVRFYVDGDRVGRGSRGHQLAKLSDTELERRWSHPTFGRKSRRELKNPNRRRANTLWRRQVGKPWFFVTIRGAEPTFRRAIERAMAKTARRIEG